jgi:hypothetical protein
MELDEESLRHLVGIIDTAIQTLRDKIVWQALATSQLGEIAEEAFQKALKDPTVLTQVEIAVVELKQHRQIFAQMLEKALKGEPIPSPIDLVN